MKRRSFDKVEECFPVLSRRRTHLEDVPEHPLSGLLENEVFLSKLLQHLVDFGLHECRLVCRKWNEVCRSLPVCLTNVPFAGILQAPAKFPRAVGLTSSSNFHFGKLIEAFYSLAHLEQLRQLELNLACTPSIFYELLPGYFAALTQLETLCLRNTSCCVTHIRASLKHLTNLTRLQLHSTIAQGSYVDPITQLNKLQELHISRVFLINKGGELLFTPGSNLTRLEVDVGRSSTESLLQVSLPDHAFPIAYLLSVQSITDYAPWLHSLALHVNRSCTYRDNWTVLHTFSRLEELAVSSSNMTEIQSETGFFSTLGCMVALRSLILAAGVFDESKAWSAISRLTALKTLRIEVQDRQSGRHCDLDCPIPKLSFLTTLTIIGPRVTRDISRLTNLVELCLVERQGRKAILGDALANLQHLERLVLSARYLDAFPVAAVSRCSNLTSLSLGHKKHFESGLIQALASLPRLTEMCYVSNPDNVVSDVFIRQLTVLHQLRRLSLDAGKEIHLLETFAEGAFPHLGYLRIHCSTLTKSKERMVFQRFPCLRSFKAVQFWSDSTTILTKRG